MIKICYRKNRNVAAVEEKAAKISYYCQKQFYKTANEGGKKLNMAWIDYQKTFDKVPHSWIIKSLELLGINDKLIAFTKRVMPNWKTRILLHPGNTVIEMEDIQIQCGIFQGNSLSPLLFCICLIPLTEQRNNLNTGYEECTTKMKISHLLYMDDLKLIAKSEEELQKQIQTIKTFSDDIHMESGLEKGAKITFKRSKIIQSQNLVGDVTREIQELEQGKT